MFHQDKGDTIDFLVLFCVKDASVDLLGELEETLLEMDISYGDPLEFCILEIMSFHPDVARNFFRQLKAKEFYYLRILKFLDRSHARVFWEKQLFYIETDLSKLSE